MKTIYATNTVDVLHLGKQGEYGNTQVYFPATGYSDCTVIVMNKRNGETYPYACTGEFVMKSGQYYFVWSIGSSETAKAGKGAVEINFYYDSALKKSATYTTYVSVSVEDSESYVPTSMQTWVGMIAQNTAQSLKYYEDCVSTLDEVKSIRDDIFNFDSSSESFTTMVEEITEMRDNITKIKETLSELESKGTGSSSSFDIGDVGSDVWNNNTVEEMIESSGKIRQIERKLLALSAGLSLRAIKGKTSDKWYPTEAGETPDLDDFYQDQIIYITSAYAGKIKNAPMTIDKTTAGFLIVVSYIASTAGIQIWIPNDGSGNMYIRYSDITTGNWKDNWSGMGGEATNNSVDENLLDWSVV